MLRRDLVIAGRSRARHTCGRRSARGSRGRDSWPGPELAPATNLTEPPPRLGIAREREQRVDRIGAITGLNAVDGATDLVPEDVRFGARELAARCLVTSDDMRHGFDRQRAELVRRIAPAGVAPIDQRDRRAVARAHR